MARDYQLKKYKIYIEDKNLYLVFNYTEYFRNIDNKIESTYILQKNEKNEVTTQEEYDIAFAEYTVGKVILFYELK